MRLLSTILLLLFTANSAAVAQQKKPKKPVKLSPTAVRQLSQLQDAVAESRGNDELNNRTGQQKIADVAVFAKAVDWQAKYNEFPKKDYAKQADRALEIGLSRAKQLSTGKADWWTQPGTTIRGYVSEVDGSIQPYALTLPEGVDPLSGKRWPLYIKLHGRAKDMNETNFIHRHEGKPLPEDQTWIQLDVYGRGNNAYRWAGEADVFEALKDVERRFRIDRQRITLHGFSMGGAGAWHLGMHHPGMWSSMGAGAGFVDFYRYQKQTEERPVWQHQTLKIYDTINYALNAANLPVVAYGGENDSQLLSGQMMTEAAKDVGVDVKLLIGKGMGHKFDDVSLKTFMDFHAKASAAGKPGPFERKKIRFITHTLKYNTCDWVTIREMEKVYQPTTVEAELLEDGTARLTTQNIFALSLNREIARTVSIDGSAPLPCVQAADGLLPEVYYIKTAGNWTVLNYQDSLSFLQNPSLNKRHDLQGPIDDAFMGSFLCVTPTGTAWSNQTADWSEWTRKRFEREFDQWMRGTVRTTKDSELSEEQIRDHHLVLFGDPGSNSVMKRIIDDLPVDWDESGFTINGTQYSSDDHAFCMIFPNPLNQKKYVVINSGQTFHEKDFKASNSWLFPRLGDIAVLKVTPQSKGYEEEIVWGANFGSNWRKLSE